MKKEPKKSSEKNPSTLPAILGSGAAEPKMSIPACPGPVFSQACAQHKAEQTRFPFGDGSGVCPSEEQGRNANSLPWEGRVGLRGGREELRLVSSSVGRALLKVSAFMYAGLLIAAGASSFFFDEKRTKKIKRKKSFHAPCHFRFRLSRT